MWQTRSSHECCHKQHFTLQCTLFELLISYNTTRSLGKTQHCTECFQFVCQHKLKITSFGSLGVFTVAQLMILILPNRTLYQGTTEYQHSFAASGAGYPTYSIVHQKNKIFYQPFWCQIQLTYSLFIDHFNTLITPRVFKTNGSLT